MKLNLKHFFFSIKPRRLKREVMVKYFEVLKKKELNDEDKFFVKEVREKNKKSEFTVTVKHIPTNTIKTQVFTGLKIDKKALALTLVDEIKKTREKQKSWIHKSKSFEGANYTTFGGVFTLPGQIAVIGKNTKMNDPSRIKAPRLTTKNYIGVELEFNDGNGHSEGDIVNQFKDANLGKYVNVTRDGSCGWEVRVLLAEDDFIEPLKKICKVITDMGFSCNSQCGTHVHLDMRKRDVQKVYTNFFFSQLFLRKFLKSDRKKNSYCKLNNKAIMGDCLSTGDRYYGINPQSFNKHKTLEIRMHHGTLDPSELIPWIKVLMKIADYEGSFTRKVNTLKQATSELKLDENLFGMLQARLRTFRILKKKTA